MDFDHAVLWVESPKKALEFYAGVLGMAPLRVQEFEEGRAGFLSVLVNENTILDLMDRNKVSGFDAGGELL